MLIDGVNLSEGSALQNLTVASGSSFPANANVAELFYKTTDNLLYQYNGTAWVTVGGSGGVSSYNDLTDKPTIPVLGAALGAASLGADSKILSAQLPSLVIVDTYVVANQAAMLALSAAEQGDIAIRTDLSKSFILTTAGYSTLGNWQELLTPVGVASSLQTARAIALTGDVTGTVNFDGTANVSIATTLKGDVVAVKTFTGAVSVNYATEGSYVQANVTGATTLTITGVPADSRAYGMTFELTNAGTNITWPGSVAWLGTAPTLRASGVSMVTLVTRNGGTNWYGSAA